MNIPQIERHNNNSFHSEYQKQDYPRLKILYSISKLLSNFESAEKSFPEILSLGAEGFPILTAILVENWEKKPRTTVWRSNQATPEQLIHATKNARKSFSYLSDRTPLEAEDLQSDSAMINDLEHPQPKSQKTKTENFIVMPLVIDKLPPLGILQLQGSAPLNEYDLEFVEALADLISVALDRYYKTRKAEEFRKKEGEENAQSLTLSRDKVTELEIERSLREVFVSLLTHDLKTPLSAALMSAQLITRKSDDSEACQTLASRIIDNIKRADQMIENLLDANRIRSGEKLPLKLEQFDMSELIKMTLLEMSTIHGDRFIFKSKERITGKWDRKGVRRIIENLCSNAIKYGDPLAPINLSVTQTEINVSLKVMNRGHLIPFEDQQKLFQQFQRGEEAKKSGQKGWGIGLTLVQGVAEAHGGNVAVESTLDAGTIFTVVLPKGHK